MNKNQWFGLFIVVIMIGSILGFASYFIGDNTETGTEPEPENNLPDSTVINMTAFDVEVKVIEILPKILFSAFTNEADISVIDSKIASVEGVYKINSRYRQSSNSEFGTALVYVAEISFDKEKSTEKIISEINAATQGTLIDPFSYENVLISVPKNVKFSNEQGFDLDYEYVDPLTLAYAVPGTIKEDNLLVRIDASFTGKTMVSSIASELKNLTAEPKYIFADQNKTIEEKLSRIIFGSTVDYSDFIESESLKEKILLLNGVLDANIDAFKPEPYFNVYFEADSALEQDFNSLLSDNNFLVSTETFESGPGYSTKITFVEGQNSKELQDLVISFLNEKASSILVTESNTQVFGSIEVSSLESNVFVSELNALLDLLNFKNNTFQQQAVVLFDVFINEEGTEFTPDQDTFIQVFVNSSRETGETVELKAQIETVREKVISVYAAEE